MNVTSSLVQILKITQESWRQDFQHKNKNGGSNVSSAATTPSTSANMLTHHRRTASGRVVFEEPGSAFLQQHRRTPSGRVIMEESGSVPLHHRRTPSGRVILEEPGSASHPTHHRRTPSGRVLLEDGTAVSEDAAASRNAAALSKMKQGLALLHSVRFVNETRQRIKFVPFLLRNSTGLPLTFATLTSAPSKVSERESEGGRREKIHYGLTLLTISGVCECICPLPEDKAWWEWHGRGRRAWEDI